MMNLVFSLIAAENFIENHNLSFDMGYTLTGIQNNGFGFGINYEQKITRFTAVKAGFSHMTLYPEGLDCNVTTVGISLDGLLYPFGKGLDKLYIGIGSGADFAIFSTLEKQERLMKDSIIFLRPSIGWKQRIYDYVMLDFFFMYNIMISEPDPLAYQAGIVSNSIRSGIKIKINIKKLYTMFKKGKQKETPIRKL